MCYRLRFFFFNSYGCPTTPVELIEKTRFSAEHAVCGGLSLDALPLVCVFVSFSSSALPQLQEFYSEL